MAERPAAKKRTLAAGILREISSGGIVYRERAGITEVALIRVRDRWCLPKGQVEANESVKAAALREILEETGLQAKPVTKLGDITYWYTARSADGEPARVFKRVHFYLLRYEGGDMSQHDAEVDEAAWFPAAAALQRLAYASEKQIMTKALAWFERKGPE